MSHPNFVILYVDSPLASAEFYGRLFSLTPVESAPTFALFVLENGMRLGLWSKHTVEPASIVTGGGCEVVFPVGDVDAVRAVYSDWTARGLPILQEPVEMDFGFTFVALDPDGHRLRVFTPSAS